MIAEFEKDQKKKKKSRIQLIRLGFYLIQLSHPTTPYRDCNLISVISWSGNFNHNNQVTPGNKSHWTEAKNNFLSLE